MRFCCFGLLLATTLMGCAASLSAATLHVDPSNPDGAFATIQAGIDALQSGDTLVIAPGEYHESVRRIGLGSSDAETVIRAAIPGTVVLRGDVPAPAFRAVDGLPFVYVTDFDGSAEAQVVNELDTLTMLRRMPNLRELQFVPATFYQDAEANKLYIATSDFRPPSEHAYSISVIATHGLHLSDAKRVTIEGIAATGYNAARAVDRSDYTLYNTYGLFIANGQQCAIRDSAAWFCGGGIGSNSAAAHAGDNVIERCTAWANGSDFGIGDHGGITLFDARRDMVRDSVAYLNLHYGINIRGGGRASEDVANRSRLLRCLGWGNAQADIKIKTGYNHVHIADRCMAMPKPSNVLNPTHNLTGLRIYDGEADSVALEDEADLDVDLEFADPANHDYRLQATSRFRGAGPDGSDRGPFPYQPAIRYVTPTGNDDADGLSIAGAWRTMTHAAASLCDGDTLYLSPGEYDGDIALGGSDVVIRGRGVGVVQLTGRIHIDGGTNVMLKRLHLREAVVTAGRDVRIEHCALALKAGDTDTLAVQHCDVNGMTVARCSGVDLRGNIYRGAFDVSGVVYSDYNHYTNDAHLDAMRPVHDVYSNGATGPHGRPFGPWRAVQPSRTMRLVAQPRVHSVTATTANLEWMTTLPARCEIAWGDTPACENLAVFEVDRFGTYSLTGLTPGRTYYFRIHRLTVPKELTPLIDAPPVALSDAACSFTTLANDDSPRVLRVAQGQSIQDAADAARPGDTVLIDHGVYNETVRIRTTGETGAPITFRCAPGAKVILAGADGKLNKAFAVAGKKHLRFDGFYFKDNNRERLQGWVLDLSGEFQLYHCDDIAITRCFSDGRGGYSAMFVAAWQVNNLSIRNCVLLGKFTGLTLQRCPNLRIEHTVFAMPMISCLLLRNELDQPATMNNNIFTDMLLKKAKQNINFFDVDHRLPCPQMSNNCFFVRLFDADTRAIVGKATVRDLSKYITDSIFTDPRFAGDPSPEGEFGPEYMRSESLELDFDSFFATNSQLTARHIGLQPDAFHDFQFDR